MSAAGCGRIRILAARRNSRSALIAKEDLAMQFEGNFVASSRENIDTVRPNQQAERKFEQIIGASPALQSVLADVERVAPTGSTVLILGETGTGKELIARAVHKRSQR